MDGNVQLGARRKAAIALERHQTKRVIGHSRKDMTLTVTANRFETGPHPEKWLVIVKHNIFKADHFLLDQLLTR